ncbi:MAG: DNA polymerase II large subunit [Candidatus Thermoplasmatota archaeon]
MGTDDATSSMLAYFRALEKALDREYAIASAARSKGLDPETHVEVQWTRDMAERVERLLGVDGIAEDIRDLAPDIDREELSIEIAKRTARRLRSNPNIALETAVRTGLAILTEGILVAPIEGIAKAEIGRNNDGSTYASIFFAGPIRSAGGTGEAMSVLLADIVRRELGLGRYLSTKEEVERWKEEIPLYKQCQHLQYLPSPAEIEMIVSSCPVCIDGEGTEEMEVSGHRDLPRIAENRVRGGGCLIIAEGLCQKAAKLQKHIRRLGIDGWEFINLLLKERAKDAQEDGSHAHNDKYLNDLIAGRPVLSHPGAKGGFRLRYGRARTTGLAAQAVHPSVMHLLEGTVAIGTQIKTERPGKAGIITPCDTIEPPIVLTPEGDLIEARDCTDLHRAQIIDLGEILISFGEFLENNHPLLPGAYSIERYAAELARAGCTPERPVHEFTFEEALASSRKHGLPLHPEFNLFWEDLTLEEIKALSEFVEHHGIYSNAGLLLPHDPQIKSILVSLGALHRMVEGRIRIERYSDPLLLCLGLERCGEKISRCVPFPEEMKEPFEALRILSGLRIMPRAPTRIGARMARPEKAKEREMKPPVHVLYPLGGAGGTQRLIGNAAGSKRPILVEIEERACPKCRLLTRAYRCTCGTHTLSLRRSSKASMSLDRIFDAACRRLGAPPSLRVKGVKGLVSRYKSVEPLEKGILRAKHGVYVFKDGTARFDLTDAPLTHVRPREIGLSMAKARELGYTKDIAGAPLTSDGQVLELKPQDIIISKKGGEYLVKVARFIDDLLVKCYDAQPYYKVSEPSDLIGALMLGLSPHTSGGVLCRLIGFVEASVCYAHPYFHAAKRRNCDGDEDCVMLLMDALLNFSVSYLPEGRGGRMDAPLILVPRIDPEEIDKEALNLDTGSTVPVEIYEAADRGEHPKAIEKALDNVGKRLGSLLQYEGFGYTHDTHDISGGVSESTYKRAKGMAWMTDLQLQLARRIRAVDENDVAERLVRQHFLPDMIGNMGKFGTQQFRCSSCNTKYRRLPLSGRCTCGRELILTVTKGGVVKYLGMSKDIVERYAVSPYTKGRVALFESSVSSYFDAKKTITLGAFDTQEEDEIYSMR